MSKESRIIGDEVHQLSDGSKARVSHIGQMYFYSCLPLNLLENPMENVRFTGAGAKAKAMEMIETALKNDVLEKED
jgi:hypothetical protein